MQQNTIPKTVKQTDLTIPISAKRSMRIRQLFMSMVQQFRTISIRTRLLVVYVGIILITFSGLTVLAGGQINVASRANYAQHLEDQIQLVAQRVGSTVNGKGLDQYSPDDLAALLKPFTTQVDGTLSVVLPPSNSAGSGGDGDRGLFTGMPELEGAFHGTPTLVERKNSDGQDTFYTAAQVLNNGRPIAGIIQLAVSSSKLQESVTRQWLVLGLGFFLLAGLAIIAALLLSQSIIQPLYKLRESAVRLSKGEFSYRVSALPWKDEIAEVAQAFNEMATQVQSMLEEQRAFASNASHELRTPLTAIRLRTEALRYDSTLDEAAAKTYVEDIDDEVAHLGNLVQDLILLSRFDAGRAERGHDQIDFERLASSLFDQMSQQAVEKHIALQLNAPEEPITVNASLSHLKVVFRNLLDNALKYTPGPGQIVWTIQDSDQAVVHTIHDSGQGISPEHLPHVYERFFRADKSHSHKIPGTGLGLSLVKSIVSAYDGQIMIASEGVGKGTTVTVIWPKGNN